MKKLKKKHMLILAIATVCCLMAYYYIRYIYPKLVYTYEDFSYTIENWNSIKIIGYKGTESELIIPTYIGSMPVTCIGDDTFWNNESIKSLTLDHEYIDIREFPFTKTKNIEIIYIGKNTKMIRNPHCLPSPALKRIIVDDGNTVYRSIDGVLYDKEMTSLLVYPENRDGTTFIVPDSVTNLYTSVFFDAKKLTEITLPPNVQVIGPSAFSGCENLRRVNIPYGVTRINGGTFYLCKSLEEINIPDSVVEILFSAFLQCHSLKRLQISKYVRELTNANIDESTVAIRCDALEAIDVDPANPYFSSVDGVLYDKAQRTLFRYPPGKKEETILIPSTVRTIYASAFTGMLYLKRIELPSSVKIVEEYAFSYGSALEYVKFNQGLEQIGPSAFFMNTSIKEVDFPASLRRIGYSIFHDCKKLEKVTFRGKTIEYYGQGMFYVSSEVTLYGPKGSWVEQLAVKEYLPFIALDE